MDKGKYMTMAKTIVFLVSFTLFQALILWNLKNLSDSIWPHVAKITLELIFWLILWQLSNGSYENHRGIGRWVQPSGLLKAFLILSVSMCLGSWALWTYIDITVSRPLNEMMAIREAMVDFYIDYKVYPGNPGPITTNIYNELRGSTDAKINTRHIDYIGQHFVKTVTDRWGHPYYFRFEPIDPKYPNFLGIDIISCGPNGLFENGKGDDLSFPPPLDR
jgi:hypothetical protein